MSLRRLLPFTVMVVIASAVGLTNGGCTAAPSLAGFGEQRQTSGDAIINGTPSDASQDSVVLIAFPAGACSGTLVAKNLVLTARHCVGDTNETTQVVTNASPSSIKIFTGRDAPAKRDAGKSAGTAQRLFTVGTKMIPDVALVLLDRDVDAPISPIRLRGGAKKREPLTIVGFGLTEKNEAAPERLQRTGKSVVNVFPDATAIGFELHKGEFTFTEAACSGDSGGPALSATSKAVVGVASRVGNGTAVSKDDPSAFCRGESTTNIYTSLEAVPELVEQAFAAAKAQATLEGATAGETGGGEAPTDAGTAAPAEPTEPTTPTPVPPVEPTEPTEPAPPPPPKRPEVDPRAEPPAESETATDPGATPPPSGTRRPSAEERETKEEEDDDDDATASGKSPPRAAACSASPGAPGATSHGLALGAFAMLGLGLGRRRARGRR